MAEQRRSFVFTEPQLARMTQGERAALSAMDTLDAVQGIMNGFTEGKQVTLAGIQACRTMIDTALDNFFIFPRPQAASIARRVALHRAHLIALEGMFLHPLGKASN